MESKCSSHGHNFCYHGFLPPDEIWCDNCDEQIVGPAYICQRCGFWLDEACLAGELPPKIIHPLHTHHNLTFFKIDDDFSDFVCDICFYISLGPRYNCRIGKFNLDLGCASSVVSQPPLVEDDRGFQELDRKKKIRHFSHSHPLDSFKYRKISENDYSCYWCNKPLSASGISYGCFTCQFFLHELCSVINMPKRLEHPFHPSHPLYLRYTFYLSFCHACNKFAFPFRGPLYCCDECDFVLHCHCGTRRHRKCICELFLVDASFWFSTKARFSRKNFRNNIKISFRGVKGTNSLCQEWKSR